MHFQINRLKSLKNLFQRFGIQAAYAKDFRSATLRFNMRGYWMKDNDKRGQNTVDGEFRNTWIKTYLFLLTDSGN